MAFDERATVERFWEAWRRGEHFPADWRDRLSIGQAYRVQLGVVARRVAAGERQVGWKVGMTSEEGFTHETALVDQPISDNAF